MKSMTVARRFLLLLVVSFALVLAFGVWRLSQLGRFPEVAKGLTANLQATFTLNQAMHRDVARTAGLVHRQFEALDPAFPETFGRLNHAVGERVTHYLTLPIGAAERLAVEEIRTAYDELGVQAAEIFSLLRAGERREARAHLDGLQALVDDLDREFSVLNDLQVAKLDAVILQLRRSIARGRLELLVVGAAVVLALALFIFELRRLVLSPIGAILATAERIHAGDRSARAPVAREDELGRLATGFNFMADSLVADQADLERRVEERTRQLEELQDQLVQSAKLSALGGLVAGVAHELNNPLTAILGYAELAERRLSGPGGDPGLLEGQRVIVSQVERCRRIISGLTQFARPQKPRLAAVHLNRLVEGVLVLREYELGTRNIAIVRDYDPAEPVIAADPSKLEQVILNLLNNAHDAIRETGRGGTIRMVTRRRGARVSLAVEDEGAGIREPDRVFEPFYTTKEVGQGTGLGLSVSYGIAEEHGGELRAENLPRGARFTLVLPVGEPAGLGPPVPAETPRSLGELPLERMRKILVSGEKAP
jgi:C4-dicarboxylate-specific signal transduction histidine kinase